MPASVLIILPMGIIITFKKKLNVLIQITIKKLSERTSFFLTKKKELKRLRVSWENFVKK